MFPKFRNGLLCLIVSFVTLASLNTAAAQDLSVGSFFQGLFRGAEYAGNPLFVSNPQNGPIFNFNDFSQRIERNNAGDGYTYEYFRFFGPDSYDNPNWLDLGPLQVQLFPDPTLGQAQNTGIHGRVGYTTRFIPEIFIETETGQRVLTQNFAGGASTFNVEPIGYNISLNTGIQDTEWGGNILIDQRANINALGFYDVEFRLVNNGEMTTDGVFAADEVVTDFDTGPINVSGHIVLDLLAGLFQNNGNAATAAPFAIGSGAAQRDIVVDELMAKLDAGERLTDDEVSLLVENMFVTAILDDPIGTLLNGLPTTIPGFEGLGLELVGSTGDGNVNIDRNLDTAPEPGVLLMFGIAGAVGCVVHPNRRRFRA